MKTLRSGSWILVIALAFAACSQQEDGAEAEDQTPVAEESAAMAEGEEAAAAEDEPMAAEETAMAGDEEREKAPPTPVVVYFKADPTDADLEWLRENGFVVEEVNGATVSGHFEYNPPPEFKDDARLDRIVPLQKPPRAN